MAIALWNKWRWDGLGMGLAGLCLVHCLATSIFLVAIASAGGILVDPVIHEIGLILAIGFGLLALGKGILQHNFLMPASIGALGIGRDGRCAHFAAWRYRSDVHDLRRCAAGARP